MPFTIRYNSFYILLKTKLFNIKNTEIYSKTVKNKA